MLTSYQNIATSIRRRHLSHLSMAILYLLCVGCIEGQVDPDVDRDDRDERADMSLEVGSDQGLDVEDSQAQYDATHTLDLWIGHKSKHPT